MRAQSALAFVCAACACTATAAALALPCRFFEYATPDTGCTPCTPHTFGTPEHCARYNETLPWTNATSEFERLQLTAFAHECTQYAAAHASSVDPVVDLCDHQRADGALAETVVLAAGGSTPTAYTSPSFQAAPISCPQGWYRVNASRCEQCPHNTTTNGGNKTSVSDCEWCELGFRWQPQTRTCSRCAQCYTTRSDAGADYTRAEHCSPCSVWADDYRRGGCNATVAGECVLHVPYADVHAVHMEPAHDAYNESWRGVFCSYEVWRNAEDIALGRTQDAQINYCQQKGLVPDPADTCKQVDMYVYEAETQKVHALFRPQSREHLFNSSQAYAGSKAAYAEMPPGVRDFTYTTGTALPGAFDDLWQSHYTAKYAYSYSAETGVVPPPFELAGAYKYPMHAVSVNAAPYYDFARAYHEHWLLGMLRPSQQACAPQDVQVPDNCAQHRLQQYGILVCGNNAHMERDDLGQKYTEATCEFETMCDVLSVFCYDAKYNSIEPFCNAGGGSVKVWDALKFYLYNATEQYAKMEQEVMKWEVRVSDRTQPGAAETTACDRTQVDLSVLVSNTNSTAKATLYEIRARDQRDNKILYARALEHELDPSSLAFQHNFTVQVDVGSSIQVEVLASNAPSLLVQVRHAGVDLNTTSSQSTYDARDGYTVCSEHTAEGLVRVETPADFAQLHSFLGAQLCQYA
tara:strand:+ start:2388 stop:4460 length:2073 start_codon:yes stop_codon:yes gene_type:complete